MAIENGKINISCEIFISRRNVTANCHDIQNKIDLLILQQT